MDGSGVIRVWVWRQCSQIARIFAETVIQKCGTRCAFGPEARKSCGFVCQRRHVLLECSHDPAAFQETRYTFL